MEFDVLVVGAGPTGCLIAQRLCREGFSVAVAEEHREIGEPVRCSGLVTKRVLAFLADERSVLNRVRGAHIFSPSAHKITIGGKTEKAVVLDRALADRGLAKAASREGAEMFVDTRAIAARRTSGGVNVTLAHAKEIKKVTCKILVGADGVKSSAARWFDLSQPEITVSGFQAEMSGGDFEENFVSLYVGNDVAPGFFSWVIPAGDTFRVGLCVREGSAYEYFNRFLTNPLVSEKLKEAEPISYQAGTIPFGLSKRTAGDNVVIVGDAACQVKATSGGGLYTGLVSADECAKVLVDSLESGDHSHEFLSSYERMWYERVGRELKRDLMLHRAFARLSDKQLERIFDLVDRKDILDTITRKGDIDYPSKLGWRLVKKEPRLLRFATPALRALFC
ncbi:MAG: geranylgeranyl reductase family protein [Thermoplasmata archaeon]